MAGNSAEAGRSVTSKVVSILLTFTDGRPRSLTEIARIAGLPVSTAHRLVTELVAWGFLDRAEDGRYLTGVPLKLIGGVGADGAAGLREHARRVMEDVVAATGTTVRLGVLEGTRVRYVEKGRGHRPLVRSHTPHLLPAHACAMGKALLAFAPPAAVDAVVAAGLERYTPHTLTSGEQLRRTLAVVRLTQVALSRWELEPGLTTVAVPVVVGTDTAVAALELHVRDLRSDLRVLQPVLALAARGLARELVGVQPASRTLLPAVAATPA